MRDILNYLQHLKYIEVVSPASGSAPARYAPTAELLAVWFRHHRAALQAVSILEPAVGTLLSRLEERHVAETFSRISAQGLLAAVNHDDANIDTAFFQVFMHRLAGNHIAWTLLMAGDGEDFPTRELVPFSVGAVARRFGVSRNHVKRLMDDAVRERLLQYDDEVVVFEDRARSSYAPIRVSNIGAAGVDGPHAFGNREATADERRALSWRALVGTADAAQEPCISIAGRARIHDHEASLILGAREVTWLAAAAIETRSQHGQASLIIQPGFAGDILFCIKIAAVWAARGHRVTFPVEERFADIAAALELPPGVEMPITNEEFPFRDAAFGCCTPDKRRRPETSASTRAL